MQENSTIHITKKKSGYRALLICPENKEPVGHTSKGYKTVAELAQALIDARELGRWNIFGEAKPYFKCSVHYDFRKPTQIIRSEPYASRQKAIQGRWAAYRALIAGRVAKLYSESTDIVSLESLLEQ